MLFVDHTIMSLVLPPVALGTPSVSPKPQAVSFVGGNAAGAPPPPSIQPPHPTPLSPGEHIYRRAGATGKRVQSNMAAKNHGIILPDATRASVVNAMTGMKCTEFLFRFDVVVLNRFYVVTWCGRVVRNVCRRGCVWSCWAAMHGASCWRVCWQVKGLGG